MTTTTSTTKRRALSHVIPWEAMTAEQQAKHLVHAHGFHPDYFWGSRPIAGGAPSLGAWHASAHEQYSPSTTTVPHVHDKPTAEDVQPEMDEADAWRRNPQPILNQPRSVVPGIDPEAYAELAQTVARQAQVLAAGSHTGPAYALARLLVGNADTLAAWTADDRT